MRKVDDVVPDQDVVGENTVYSSGSVYIFRNNAGVWEEAQKIVASDRLSSAFFGNSVSINGDYIIVGSMWNDLDAEGSNSLIQAGSAYIFSNKTGTWLEEQKIVASERSIDDCFGWCRWSKARQPIHL